MADDEDEVEVWGEWCRTCKRRARCTKLCRPLAARLRTRCSSKRSVPARNFSDLPMAERAAVGQALYGDAEMLEPHKRRHDKH